MENWGPKHHTFPFPSIASQKWELKTRGLIEVYAYDYMTAIRNNLTFININNVFLMLLQESPHSRLAISPPPTAAPHKTDTYLLSFIPTRVLGERLGLPPAGSGAN